MPNYIETETPHSLPPDEAVKESGHTTQHATGDAYLGAYAPPPAATQGLPHPKPIPVGPMSPDQFPLITGDQAESFFAAMAHLSRMLKEPRTMPWEYRGPLRGSSTDGSDVVLDTVPPGEIWEIERIAIESGNAVVWSLYRNLVATGNLEDQSSSGANYLEDYSPPIRLGAGEHLIVHGASQNAPYSVHVQYRFTRVPKPGATLNEIPKVESLVREP